MLLHNLLEFSTLLSRVTSKNTWWLHPKSKLFY